MPPSTRSSTKASAIAPSLGMLVQAVALAGTALVDRARIGMHSCSRTFGRSHEAASAGRLVGARFDQKSV